MIDAYLKADMILDGYQRAQEFIEHVRLETINKECNEIKSE